MAYQPDFIPTNGLTSAQVTLGGVTAATSANGKFSIKTSITPSTDMTILNVSLPGYIPTQYPWFPSDTVQPLSLGLYPEQQVFPRPGLMKGVTMMDAGGQHSLLVRDGVFAPTIDRIRNTVGANLVAYVETPWITRFDPATNQVAMTADGWGWGTRSAYESAVGMARARGLQFMMLLGLMTANPGDSATNANFAARFSIPQTNTAFWDAFFAAWRPLVLERAAWARDLGIEYLALNSNTGYLSRLEPARWAQLIQAIRAVGYTGKIVYFGFVILENGNNEINYVDPAFPALFDAIGFNITAAITKTTPGEVLDRAQTRARMRSDMSTFLARQVTLPVPIVLNITTASVFGAVTNTEYIEPGLGAEQHSLAPSRIRDYQQQADMYQAVAEAINGTPTGNGRVMGLMTWGYWYRDNPTFRFFQGDGAYDKSANVRGKPAELVLNWWFKRW